MTPVTQDNWQPGTPPGGRRRTQHPTAENPFEEPEQSPELRQERSPDLYRATNLLESAVSGRRISFCAP